MLFSKLSDGLVASALEAARPIAQSFAASAMPTEEEKAEEKRQHRRSQHHRRRKSHSAKNLEFEGEELAPGDDLGWLQAPRLSVAPLANAPGAGQSSTNSALERATHALESLGQGSAKDIAPVGRQIYHEQLANAQLALSATRDELERVVRDKTEEVAREHAKRERAEKEARRERHKSEEAHEAHSRQHAELKAKIEKLMGDLDDLNHEKSRAAAAHGREKEVHQEALDESVQVRSAAAPSPRVRAA